jgi:hypothetical protein
MLMLTALLIYLMIGILFCVASRKQVYKQQTHNVWFYFFMVTIGWPISLYLVLTAGELEI